MLKTIAPGQPGALKWTRRYGDALVCVRYRAEAGGLVRWTTVELVVDVMPVQKRRRNDPIVSVEGGLRDKATRARALQAGAVWDRQRQAWRMPLSVVRLLKLSATGPAGNGKR